MLLEQIVDVAGRKRCLNMVDGIEMADQKKQGKSQQQGGFFLLKIKDNRNQGQQKENNKSCCFRQERWLLAAGYSTQDATEGDWYQDVMVTPLDKKLCSVGQGKHCASLPPQPVYCL